MTSAGAVDTRIHQTVGKYQLVSHVADGAMGRVYMAKPTDGEGSFAVKILHPDVAKDSVAVERFRREFDTAKELSSPYVVNVYDYGNATDGAPYIAMEFLDGIELTGALKKNQQFAPARWIPILAQVALGLDDAHSFGVVHRDLKPDNLFLCSGDRVRILDFGSVKLQLDTGPKLTAFGTTLGSPYYMSPEQAMGKADIDNRSDLFALAAITYEVLSGKLAFEGATVAQILMKIVNEMPPRISASRSDIPASVDDAIEAGLAKDKSHRQRSVLEFASAIISAFGLEVQANRDSLAKWAAASEQDVSTALKASKPKESKRVSFPASPSDLEAPTPVRSGPPMGLLLGVGALIIAGIAAFFLLR